MWNLKKCQISMVKKNINENWQKIMKQNKILCTFSYQQNPFCIFLKVKQPVLFQNGFVKENVNKMMF